MKTPENLDELVNAVRLAAAVPDDSFWKELEERMNIRDEANAELVAPRDLAHS